MVISSFQDRPERAIYVPRRAAERSKKGQDTPKAEGQSQGQTESKSEKPSEATASEGKPAEQNEAT